MGLQLLLPQSTTALWYCGSSTLTNLDLIIQRLRHCGTAVAVIQLNFCLVTAGPQEQEICVVQSGSGVLQSLLQIINSLLRHS